MFTDVRVCVCIHIYIYIYIYISIYLSISISIYLSFDRSLSVFFLNLYLSLSLHPVLLAFVFSRSYPSLCGTSTSNKYRFAAPFASAKSRKMERDQDITRMPRIPHFIDMFSLLLHSMDSS